MRRLKNEFCHCWGIPADRVKICRRMSANKILPNVIDGENGIRRKVWGYNEIAGWFVIQAEWGLMVRQRDYLHKNPKVVVDPARVPMTVGEVCLREKVTHLCVATHDKKGIRWTIHPAPCLSQKETWLRQYQSAVTQFNNWIEENGFPEKEGTRLIEYQIIVWGFFVEDTHFAETAEMLPHVYEDIKKHVFECASGFYSRHQGPYDKG